MGQQPAPAASATRRKHEDAMSNWWQTLRSRSIIVRGGFLGAIVLVMSLVVGPIVGQRYGPAGVEAMGAAAAVCLLGAWVALAVAHWLRAPAHVLVGMLLGMAARMGIPLGFGVGCHLYGGALAEAGVLYYLLLFYPVTLGVETALSLPRTDGHAHGRSAARDVS